ncbi:hypothetical protein GGF46_000315 [Coemansia sp. RSA 552]|nr:hypothetical protein GGF46_000315 [Coemansia sp. RSA 552]
MKQQRQHGGRVHEVADPGNLDTGIVEIIGHAFPGYGSGYTTPVPEAVRARLEAVARTFILPRAPWEINASGGIVASMQRFVGGERIACGVLDEAKNEVVDLLYANVYIRYCQTRR